MIVEGSGDSQVTLGGDLFEIGDPAGAHPTPGINVSNVHGRNVELINPPLNYAALHITSDTADTTGIDIEGLISGTAADPGRGAQIDSCELCDLKFTPNTSTDYNLFIGETPTTSACTGSNIGPGGVVYDGGGAEAGLTTCIDPAAASLIQFPVRQLFASAATINPAANPLRDTTEFMTATSSATLSASGNFSAFSPLLTVLRSGPTAAFTDTWDNATNIITALGGSSIVIAGQNYYARVCNQTLFYTETVVPGLNETMSPTSIAISPGSCERFVFNIVSTSTPSIVIVPG